MYHVKINGCVTKMGIITFPDEGEFDLDESGLRLEHDSDGAYIRHIRVNARTYLPHKYDNVSSLAELRVRLDVEGIKGDEHK